MASPTPSIFNNSPHLLGFACFCCPRLSVVGCLNLHVILRQSAGSLIKGFVVLRVFKAVFLVQRTTVPSPCSDLHLLSQSASSSLSRTAPKARLMCMQLSNWTVRGWMAAKRRGRMVGKCIWLDEPRVYLLHFSRSYQYPSLHNFSQDHVKAQRCDTDELFQEGKRHETDGSGASRGISGASVPCIVVREWAAPKLAPQDRRIIS